MVFMNCCSLFLIWALLSPNLALSNDEGESDIFGIAMGRINIILSNEDLSDDERKSMIIEVTRQLSKDMGDITLTPEEAEKLAVPLNKWTNDLKKKIEDFHARGGDLHPEDLMQAIDESMENHPDLEFEVGKILKAKDETKVERFFSKIKSSAKHLGHNLKEKLKSGWKKTKNFLKNKISLKNAFIRISRATFSLIDLLVVDPIIAIILIPFKGFGYAGRVLDGMTIAAALKIYDFLFKFHGDPDYIEKTIAHVRGHGGLLGDEILSL